MPPQRSNKIGAGPSIISRDSSALMPPPPDPMILGTETAALQGSLRATIVRTAQLIKHISHTRRFHLPYERSVPSRTPRRLVGNLSHELERYDSLCDAIEAHFNRAIAVLRRDLAREEARLREQSEAANRPKEPILGNPSTKLSTSPTHEPSDIIPSGSVLPRQPITPHPRRASTISLSSLNRNPFPLKLDLSATALKLDDSLMAMSSLASPVTLAPKSARPQDTMEIFSAFEQGLPTDSSQNGRTTASVEAGTSADKPIDLDADSLDIDMSIDDLFGDQETAGELFSPPIERQSAGILPTGTDPIPMDKALFGDIDSNPVDAAQLLASLDNVPPDLQSDSSAGDPMTADTLLASLESAQDTSGTQTNFDLPNLDLAGFGDDFFGSEGQGVDIGALLSTENPTEKREHVG